MAKRASPRLKVYQAQFGFHDSVVAAPNQTAALAAWGTRQNLFAEGQARVAVDEAAVKAALAHPLAPLRRPVGSSDPYEVDPANLPKVPAAPKRVAAKAAPEAKTARVRAPPPDRSELDAAEAVLAKLEKARGREEAALLRRREALEADEAEAKRRYLEAREKAEAAVKSARAAYVRGGG